MTINSNPEIRLGQFVQDGRAEAEVVEISPDRHEVVIEYTDDHKQIRLMANRFEARSGKIHVV